MFTHRTEKISALVLLTTAAWLSGCAVPPPAPMPSHAGRDTAITLSVLGTGAALIYFGVHGSHFIKGCVQQDKTGLAIGNPGDENRFMLAGSITSIQPGEKLRLKGKKEDLRNAAGNRTFLVERVVKDYGPCTPGVAP